MPVQHNLLLRAIRINIHQLSPMKDWIRIMNNAVVVRTQNHLIAGIIVHTLDEIIEETLSSVSSERTSRVIDNEAAGSMERRKREGYF